METASIAVLVPVLNRPRNVRPLCDSFLASDVCGRATLYFIAQDNDYAEVVAIEENARRCKLIVVPADKQSWAKKINAGYEATTEPWMLLCGDDVRFHPGWIDALAPHMANHDVIGTSAQTQSTGRREQRQNARGRVDRTPHSPHPLVARSYADEFGTVDERRKVVHDGYHHNFPDTELYRTALIRGRYGFARECVIEHRHPIYATAEDDDTYRLGRSRFEDDERLFQSRAKRFGF